MATKVKAKSITYYKKKLDAIFSKYIRERDGHKCFTCPKQMEPWQSQNGHFVPRQYLKTRWDERNCNCQCYACNVLYNGQPSAYAQNLVNKYGAGIIEELEKDRHVPVKLDIGWYLQKIEEYTHRLAELSTDHTLLTHPY